MLIKVISLLVELLQNMDNIFIWDVLKKKVGKRSVMVRWMELDQSVAFKDGGIGYYTKTKHSDKVSLGSVFLWGEAMPIFKITTTHWYLSEEIKRFDWVAKKAS